MTGENYKSLSSNLPPATCKNVQDKSPKNPWKKKREKSKKFLDLDNMSTPNDTFQKPPINISSQFGSI